MYWIADRSLVNAMEVDANFRLLILCYCDKVIIPSGRLIMIYPLSVVGFFDRSLQGLDLNADDALCSSSQNDCVSQPNVPSTCMIMILVSLTLTCL